ncbi:hypothetical protein HMPREF9140_02054 [Prevotella micans F0438]|uniref:Uncharacterized protein n=1 Tax=Prevotella micans F0438 TaxID=883158 RepID=H1Q566_9BACT|nr:hypothetical protein HMPREF9140_02054 [Prevotella micans F0438]
MGNEFGAKTVYTALILGPMIDFLGTVIPIKESIFAVHVAGQTIANPLVRFVVFRCCFECIAKHIVQYKCLYWRTGYYG